MGLEVVMARQRNTNRDPLRAVVKATEHEGGTIFAEPRMYFRWWELTLECGHTVERSARYEKGAAGGRGFHAHPAPPDKMLPPPKRARCDQCARLDEDRSVYAG